MSSLEELMNSWDLEATITKNDFSQRLAKKTVVRIDEVSLGNQMMTVTVLSTDQAGTLEYVTKRPDSTPFPVGYQLRLPIGYIFGEVSPLTAPKSVSEYALKTVSKNSDAFETCLIIQADTNKIALSPMLSNYLNLKEDSRIVFFKEHETNCDYLAVSVDPTKGYALKDSLITNESLCKLLGDKYIFNPYQNSDGMNKVFVNVYQPYSSIEHPDMILYKLKLHLTNLRTSLSSSKINTIRSEILTKISRAVENF